jgi:hypothetical protein
VPFYTNADLSFDFHLVDFLPKTVAPFFIFFFGFMISYHVLKFWAYFYFPQKLKNEFFLLDSVSKSLKHVILSLVFFNPETILGLIMNIVFFFLCLFGTFLIFMVLNANKIILRETTIMYAVPSFLNFLSYFISTFLTSSGIVHLEAPPQAEEEDLAVLLKRAALQRPETDPLEQLLAFDRLTSAGHLTTVPINASNHEFQALPLTSHDAHFKDLLGPLPKEENTNSIETRDISELPPSEGSIKGRSLGSTSSKSARQGVQTIPSNAMPPLYRTTALILAVFVFLF